MGGVAPDVYTYSGLVTAYARLGDVENAVKVLSDMAKSGVKPNRFTLSSVMQVCKLCRTVRSGAVGCVREQQPCFKLGKGLECCHIFLLHVTTVKANGSLAFGGFALSPVG